MANVCRPLQNGLPALRFAVIRGFWGFAFGIWALNPHAWVSLCLASRATLRPLKTQETGCFEGSNSAPRAPALDADAVSPDGNRDNTAWRE